MLPQSTTSRKCCTCGLFHCERLSYAGSSRTAKKIQQLKISELFKMLGCERFVLKAASLHEDVCALVQGQ